ncbi:ABC transporter permease [Prosthecomicrobium pneumaticum]|uniref:Ribose transport system permease protein n=1 Tax=Prosthecomicrobium pneumaticum TaxID=81895 RepID=A0A7W9FQT6_9HYPH|nr:ABC transporter permease [Prosthecomicrobium pneumaticum]MBB5755172.1 ribose transport system permease protein [Prosthecomicrobium pneumaticum]
MSTLSTPSPASARGPRIRGLVSRLGLLLVILIFIVVMTFVSPVFLTLANFKNLFIQSTILAVLALGQTYVIMTRGIDLSIGGTMALSSALAIGLSVYSGVPAPLALLVGLGVGALIGTINGFAVTQLGITPLIVTLATLSIARGATFVYTNGANVTPVPAMVSAFGRGELFGVPYSVILLVLLAIGCHFILARTVFGRSVYATGGNETASRLAGIPTDRVILVTYVLCGVLAAVAGLVLAARLESAGPRAGVGIELTVIAACVIGGTSLFGGTGSILGTLLGVVLISLVSNAINLLGVPPAWDDLVKGFVIFLAAVVDVYRRKFARS